MYIFEEKQNIKINLCATPAFNYIITNVRRRTQLYVNTPNNIINKTLMFSCIDKIYGITNVHNIE